MTLTAEDEAAERLTVKVRGWLPLLPSMMEAAEEAKEIMGVVLSVDVVTVKPLNMNMLADAGTEPEEEEEEEEEDQPEPVGRERDDCDDVSRISCPST